MADPIEVVPVKPLVALLWANQDCCRQAISLLEARWGPLDFQGGDYPFDQTDYYRAEMGAVLFRRLLAFESLHCPDQLAQGKIDCIQLENELAIQGRRTVNLDFGYLDHNKLVLASIKPAGQKIYLGRGVYADLVGRWGAGRYQPFEWTFPDFREGRYDAELTEIRRRYLQQLKV